MKFMKRHGLTDTPVHRSWMSMRQRCNNPRDRAYKNYGGRGIMICQQWDSFERFLADMGIPEFGMQLDRCDVNGDYEPSNCRWATIKQQARNKRDTVLVEFNGKTKSLRDWADELDIKFATLYRRVILNGEPIFTALARRPMFNPRWHSR